MNNIFPATPENIRKAAQIIREGGLVAFPTETVYGLGADAFNTKAVAKIFEVKRRPQFDPIIVHIAHISQLPQLCSGWDERAEKLIQRFWPGPLTLVLPKSNTVPEIVTAGLPTVAIRMPSHPVASSLIREASTPIAAPSANPFGYLSPTTAEHVAEQLGKEIDIILNGGRCSVGVESTVVSLLGEEPLILRLGGLPLEHIEEVIGKVSIRTYNPARPECPGQLRHHYSPHTPVRLFDNVGERFKKGTKIGLLALTAPKEISPCEAVEILSKKGDLKEAAANLFSCLHNLDKAGLDVIYVEPVPEVGLGRTIMDRLKRASHRTSTKHRSKDTSEDLSPAISKSGR